MAVFDNRGIGASSVPADRRQYTTDAMAQDALAVMVGLWEGGAERPVMACTDGVLPRRVTRWVLAAPDISTSLKGKYPPTDVYKGIWICKDNATMTRV